MPDRRNHGVEVRRYPVRTPDRAVRPLPEEDRRSFQRDRILGHIVELQLGGAVCRRRTAQLPPVQAATMWSAGKEAMTCAAGVLRP